MKVHIKVPATSANLGPGFDALGLALDLWNEAEFATADSFSLSIKGEGLGRLAHNEKNLIVRSAQRLYQQAGKPVPALRISCINRIPLGSGMGSSSAAILAGLLGANALLGSPISSEGLLDLATEIEGHPDNVAPALIGGLVVSTLEEGHVLARKIPLSPQTASLHITVVVPDFNFPTKPARAVLPRRVAIKDAVHNISRTVLVTEALRTADLDLLGRVITDNLHQPYRLPLIPRAREAMQAARDAGAAAVALSGAGPGLIAFSAGDDTAIGEAIGQAFESGGLKSRVFHLGISDTGAHIEKG